ncbi:MAG: F0F1 ATP synthase subunit B [Candidatus Tectomicrobia bacterium]|uniref:ATP synthase subunit b n=1 Tax=Tectimicrobiota bacterium TaxID=2528274 RepID=A0A932CQF6_UNCTE|nr:F0F1 ATP synthase subunit B [Candidatus Tectomicrobia bacterium]
MVGNQKAWNRGKTPPPGHRPGWVIGGWIFLWITVILLLREAGWALASEEGGHGGEAASLKPLLWHIINFVILVVALYYLAGKQITAYFAERRQRIGGAIQEAQQARQEIERRMQEYELKLKNAVQEVAQMKAEAERSTVELQRKLKEEAEKAAQRILQQARLNIKQEEKKARSNLQTEASLLALSLAEQTLKDNINQEDQRRLFKDYLSYIGDGN